MPLLVYTRWKIVFVKSRQEALGVITDSKEWQAEGKANERIGKLKREVNEDTYPEV